MPPNGPNPSGVLPLLNTGETVILTLLQIFRQRPEWDPASQSNPPDAVPNKATLLKQLEAES